MSTPLSRRPEDTKFKQQRLNAWQPVLTPERVSLIFLLIGIIFIPIGAVLLQKSNEIVEVSLQYDGDGADSSASSCAITEANAATACSVTLTVPEKMEGTVWVYYQIDNFYQNHRRYVKSRSATQLLGEEDVDGNFKTDCDPLYETDSNLKLNPCGLIANSMFNDVIELSTVAYDMSTSDISWQSDRNDKFKQVAGFKSAQCTIALPCTTVAETALACTGLLSATDCESYTDSTGTDYVFYYPDNAKTQYLYETYPDIISPLEGVESERFIVWMRTAALPNFRKPYGKISGGVEKGTDLTFAITNNFDVSEFEGKKYIVLSTVNAYGGKNPFLGVAYLVVGALCLFFSVIFFLKQKLYPRPLGDVHSLKWN